VPFHRFRRPGGPPPADRALRQALALGLEELRRRRAQAGVRSTDIQLVVRIAGADAYPAFRAGQEAAWREQDTRWSTAGWPDAILAGTHAAVLLPLLYDAFPAGALPAPLAARPVAEPVFGTGADAGLLALDLVAAWVSVPAAGETAQLAPVLVERVAGAVLPGRRIEDWGLRWPLPPQPALLERT
jgi:hypothetical protein